VENECFDLILYTSKRDEVILEINGIKYKMFSFNSNEKG